MPLRYSPSRSDKYLPKEVLRRHSRGLADLPEQFVLAETPQGPDTWAEHRLGSWVLRRHPTLPRISLFSDGQPIGWLLGYPIDENGVLMRDGSAQQGVPTDWTALHGWLDSIAGRWAVVLVDSKEPALRLDAAGSLSLVYCPDQRVVASTPNLVPYTDHTPDDLELVRALGIPWAMRQYPMGLTPRLGVRRLLPNHQLNLVSFEARRFWPTGDVDMSVNPSHAVQRIGEITRRNIAAVMEAVPCSLPLTSGRDSRMLLACARDFARDLHVYTVPFPDGTGTRDARVAKKIARELSLDHDVVRYLRPREEDLDEWVFRVSCSIGNVRGWLASTTYKTLDPRRSRLTGHIGELGRAKFWEAQDTPDTNLSPERLLAIRRTPSTPRTRNAILTWLSGIPTTNALTILNLLYWERVTCWGGVIPYSEYMGPGYLLFPMNHTEILRLMVGLPPEFQRSQRLQEAVIAEQWPQLMRWPFNRDTGLQRAHSAQAPYLKVRRGVHRALANLNS